ncbi:MAG: hypothetical protein KHX14_10740 [[Clostridium] spiroforme]|uniref:Terminase small subunit n=1 Tax=Thomasclavelia spiroformis TaxID=29348 RepID=A0A943EK33_9FIRM|nr:hypothetical protein [Thomasclavelia spiroformis]MBS5589258.1 hypothetical protein [Thomasclavelia spiroformis]
MSKLNQLGVDIEDADNQMLMLTVAFQKAVSGDVKAMHFIKEITGATATTELERQRLKLEKEKVAIAKERLELDKARSPVDDVEEYEDDGFIEALSGTAISDWSEGQQDG